MACKGRTNCAADTEASTDSSSQAPFYYIFLLVSPSSFHLSCYLGQFIDAKSDLSGYFACENEEKMSPACSTSMIAKCLQEAESLVQKHFVGS